MRLSALAVTAFGFFANFDTRAAENGCPDFAQSAKRLLMVTASQMSAIEANVRLFERKSPDEAWSQVRAAKKATLGRGGLGWGWNQQSLAVDGEPSKLEGDGRTPSGVFVLERAFGFGKTGYGKNYLRLVPHKSYCVDDPRSPYYNKIIDKSEAGENTSGEDMGTISLYRNGLQVDFPTNAAKRGGSCIFLHVWHSPSSPTSGCVALKEKDVKELQEWATKQPTIIVIAPERAIERLLTCFPGVL
jgi:L,D-peptidoglycan transpeptidase YkuD (ErfK/YbiS/YcfS/YnhG family)